MDANNSMINNTMSEQSISTKKDSKISKSSDISFSMTISKSKKKSKPNKAPTTLTIECKSNPKQKFEAITEELTFHIISCDDCLKQLLLYQARQEKRNKELLNNKKEKNKNHKKKGRIDINNSMQESVDNIQNEINEDSEDD